MPFHNTLPFNELHISRIRSGSLGERPIAPAGTGDMFYDSDNNDVYISNAAATTWVLFTGSNTIASVNDIGDANIVGVSEGDILRWRTNEWVNEELVIPTPPSEVGDLTNVTNITPTVGEIFYYDGTQFQYLPVGAEGQILRVRGAVFGRLQWEDVPPAENIKDFNNILVDDDGQILIDEDGNIIEIE